MNIIPSSNCIICLEEAPISDSKNGILPIPCHCKAFIHKKCFHQLNSHYCVICKQPNCYSNPNISLQKISREIEIKIDNSAIEFNVERQSRTSFCKIILSNFRSLVNLVCKIRQKVSYNINEFCRKNRDVSECLGKMLSDIICFLLIIILECITISLLLAIAYFIGFLVIYIIILLIWGISYDLYSDIGLIILNIIIGGCCSLCCLLGKKQNN